MKLIRIGTPCRGADRAKARRHARADGERWYIADRDSKPDRMRKAWRLEEDRRRLVHHIFWAQVAGVARVMCRGPR